MHYRTAKTLDAAVAGLAGNRDNLNRDGSVNWDYVEADLFIDYPELVGDDATFADAVDRYLAS